MIWHEQQISKKRAKRDFQNADFTNPLHFIDPQYKDQWYLVSLLFTRFVLLIRAKCLIKLSFNNMPVDNLHFNILQITDLPPVMYDQQLI